MINLFKKTKTISNIKDLLSLPPYKNAENIKDNGKLLYELFEHKFSVINKRRMEIDALIPYTYLEFKNIYGDFKDADLMLDSKKSDEYTYVFKTEDAGWSVVYDDILGTVVIYPNIHGWLSDKQDSDLEMVVEDLSESDREFLESFTD